MGEIVELNVEKLDELIVFWRLALDKAVAEGREEDEQTAKCYIDAYQTVRVLHGLDLLPRENHVG